MTAMEIRPYEDADRRAAKALLLARQPHQRERWVDDTLDNPSVTLNPNLVAVDPDGDLLGWGVAMRRDAMPEEMWFGGLVVRADLEGTGVGSRLHDAMRGGLHPTCRLLRGVVMDDDERSLAVAEHWGYSRFQHGITSRFDLVDLPEPRLDAGLELESNPELTFDDDE